MNHKIKYCTSVHSKDSESNPVVQTTFEKKWLPFNSDDQKKILGTELVKFSKQIELLNALGFEVENLDDTSALRDNVVVGVPSWRTNDVVHSADLVEEFIRIVGIDHVPAIPMDIVATVNNDDTHIPILRKLYIQLCALGYNQVVGLNFMRADDYQKLNLQSSDALGVPVAILNPVLGDEPFMQTTLIPDLLRKVERNLNYGVKSGQIFSSARVFYKEENKEKPTEVHKIAGVCFGQKTPKTWQNSSAQSWSIHDVMQHITTLLQTLNIPITFLPLSTSVSPFSSALHPKKQLSISSGGWLGELHPKVARAYGVDNTDIYLFEIDFDES